MKLYNKQKVGYLFIAIGIVHALTISPYVLFVTLSGTLAFISLVVSGIIIWIGFAHLRIHSYSEIQGYVSNTRLYILRNRLFDIYKEYREASIYNPSEQNITRRETVKQVIDMIDELNGDRA